jgi:hypothetical protein
VAPVTVVVRVSSNRPTNTSGVVFMKVVLVAVVGAGEIAPEGPCTKKALPSTAVVRAGSSQ